MKGVKEGSGILAKIVNINKLKLFMLPKGEILFCNKLLMS
jgi:hypothetical protein